MPPAGLLQKGLRKKLFGFYQEELPKRCSSCKLLRATDRLWYTQWKVCIGCLEKFALGNSRGSSDFPEGRSPEGMSDYPRDLPWANLPDNA